METKKELLNKFSSALNHIKGSPIREFDSYASSIEGIIKLTLGEPDFDTSDVVKESLKTSIDNNRTHYSLNSGVLELRKSFSKKINSLYNVNYSEDEVIVTVGASAAIEHTISAITNPGDTILVVTPYFTLYSGCAYLNNCEVGYIDTLDTGFKLTPELFEESYKKFENVKGIVLNYPNNPSGVSYTREELEQLANVFRKYDIFVISDEIYSEISYNFKHTSLVELIPEQTILITGLSKSHAMTGWRVGFVVAPLEIAKKILVYHMFTVSGIPTFIQDASITAITDEKSIEYTDFMVSTYKNRKEYLIPELRNLGFEIGNIDGTFYVFAKIPNEYRYLKSMEFCKFVAREAKVAFIPGNAFGDCYDEYIRISFATSMENLEQAISRLKEVL